MSDTEVNLRHHSVLGLINGGWKYPWKVLLVVLDLFGMDEAVLHIGMSRLFTLSF